MVYRRKEARRFPIVDCHDGRGRLMCTEMLAEYDRPGAGFRFVHDNVLEPGAIIGEHEHQGDEEMYVILDGDGVMRVDGENVPVGPGDICVTRSGHSHALANGPERPMHILVIGIGL